MMSAESSRRPTYLCLESADGVYCPTRSVFLRVVYVYTRSVFKLVFMPSMAQMIFCLPVKVMTYALSGQSYVRRIILVPCASMAQKKSPDQGAGEVSI